MSGTWSRKAPAACLIGYFEVSVPLPDVPDDVPLGFEPFGVGFWFVDVEPFGVVVVPAPDCPELLVPDVDPADGVVESVDESVLFESSPVLVDESEPSVDVPVPPVVESVFFPVSLPLFLSEFVVESLSVSVVPDWFCILSCVPLFPLP